MNDAHIFQHGGPFGLFFDEILSFLQQHGPRHFVPHERVHTVDVHELAGVVIQLTCSVVHTREIESVKDINTYEHEGSRQIIWKV